MSKQKDLLGKGIRALLTNIEDDTNITGKKEIIIGTSSGGINFIPLNNIEVNPFQPRVSFDEDSLNYLSTIDFTEAQAFSFGENPCRIDFLTKINQVDFDEAYAEHLKFELGNITLPIIQLKHLILSKNNTGRIKDAADIEELQRISRTKNE
jgi:hypothetical protein